MRSKFAGRCGKCGGRINAGDFINWQPGTKAVHEKCPENPVIAPTIVMNLKPIADFIAAAAERGLKYPKARFLAPGGGEIRLSVAGNKSKAPGAVQVKHAQQGVTVPTWIGRVNPTGEVVGPLADKDSFVAALAKIAEDPAKAASEYGALMGNCSFCGLALTDAGSVEVGYGPVCAKHYGLPHKPKGTPKLVGAGEAFDVQARAVAIQAAMPYTADGADWAMERAIDEMRAKEGR